MQTSNTAEQCHARVKESKSVYVAGLLYTPLLLASFLVLLGSFQPHKNETVKCVVLWQAVWKFGFGQTTAQISRGYKLANVYTPTDLGSLQMHLEPPQVDRCVHVHIIISYQRQIKKRL